MPPVGQAIPRHLVFVLESDEVVLQRGANIVEVLETRQQRVFNDFDRDHDVTDAELESLLKAQIISGYDTTTVWLARADHKTQLAYYFLDTQLPPLYEDMVSNLLQAAALADKYVPKTRMGRVAIMGPGGEPFGSLPDAEFALTVVQQALAGHLTDLSIESVQVIPEKYETQTLNIEHFTNLIQSTPSLTMADQSVLLIASEPDLTAQAQQTLDVLGIELRMADTGRTALEILMDEEPDLVIIDLILPDMHGYEVIAKIRKDPLTSHTPIIALSSYNSQADVVFALNVARVEDFMLKPIDPNVLRHRVIHLLDRRL